MNDRTVDTFGDPRLSPRDLTDEGHGPGEDPPFDSEGAAAWGEEAERVMAIEDPLERRAANQARFNVLTRVEGDLEDTIPEADPEDATT